LIVDTHPAFFDPLVGFAARGHAQLTHALGQAHAERGVRCGFVEVVVVIVVVVTAAVRRWALGDRATLFGRALRRNEMLPL
jgi:hypothetical protein